MTLIQELRWRGMIQDIMPGTEELFEKEQVSGYIGFDPTSDSLHIGSLVPILLYGWWNFYVMYWNFTPIRYGPFFFATMWVYIFLFEFIFLRTPAKWMTGTKVVGENGKRPNIFQIFLRTTIHCTIISMFGLAWNGQPFHDTFSKTKLVAAAN